MLIISANGRERSSGIGNLIEWRIQNSFAFDVELTCTVCQAAIFKQMALNLVRMPIYGKVLGEEREEEMGKGKRIRGRKRG